MSGSRLQVLVAYAGVVVGAAGSFLVTTVVMDELPDTLTVASGAVGVLIASLVVWGAGSVSVSGLLASYDRSRQTLIVAALSGVLMFWLAPALALSQRASDAPPGTEVILFTASAWGLVCVIAAYLRRDDRPSVVAVPGALLGLTGGMAVLANWERPSSFSPFVRFPAQEVLMLVAGCAFALGSLLFVGASKRLGVARTAPVAVLFAAVPAALAGGVSAGTALPAIALVWPAMMTLAVAQGLVAVSWMRLLSWRGESGPAGAWLLVPGALTTLAGAEKLTNIYGPDPVRWVPVIAGVALSVAGAGVVWAANRADRSMVSVRRAPWIAGGLAVVVPAVVSLATPALKADVHGAFDEVFQASWSMLGLESAVGWCALSAGLLAAAGAFEMARGRKRTAAAAAAAALVAVASTIMLADTPLRTWTRWIPADVQQTYGTEYARMAVAPVMEPVRLASYVMTSVLALVVLYSALGPRGRQD